MHPGAALVQREATLTAPSRKASLYAAGLIGAAVAGFFSHFAVPGPPAAIAAESLVERRLEAIELKQDTILAELRDQREMLAFVRGRLNMGSGK